MFVVVVAGVFVAHVMCLFFVAVADVVAVAAVVVVLLVVLGALAVGFIIGFVVLLCVVVAWSDDAA